MSIYQPVKLSVAKIDRGWMIYDEFGEYDGPYESEFVALEVFCREREPAWDGRRWYYGELG